MRKLFCTYSQNNLTKNNKNHGAIDCSIFRTWLKIVEKFQNWYTHLKNIN